MNLKTFIYAGAIIAASPAFYIPASFTAEIHTDVSQKMKPATVKVLLVENAPSIILEAKGKYQISNPANDFVIGNGSFSKRARVSHENAGMKWGELIPGMFQMRIIPMNAETTILVNGIEYRGCVEIYDNAGKFSVINEVDVESYLRSTLASAFTKEMDQEVLNALVIVARTNVYHMLSKKPVNPLYQVKAKESDYRGHGITLQNVALEGAISSTRHAILTYNDAPFAATWTENSAGKTADYASIYRKNTPSPSGVEIPLAESDRQKLGWSFSVTRDQLANIASVRKVSQISLFSEKNSGKVYAVKVSDGDNSQDVDFFTLQAALGETKLKSNDFTLDVKGDTVTFKGYGTGNGTGLCLYSASLMAKQGQDAGKILSTFFPDTKLEKLRNAPPSKASKSGHYSK
ncbi:MAG: SpoIID/LytB domain-containing protein [Chlamydiae bacterium]|nr:SpoIID/LytB domain-containing protein [Chlamydiota bacterium]